MHPYAGHFLAVIHREVTASLSNAGPNLLWQDFDDLFQRITLQVIFGEGNHDVETLQELTSMMRESNRVFALRPSRWFDSFHARLKADLTQPTPNGLTALCRHIPSTDETKVSSQITHWLFAMSDTLAENGVLALSLIITHPNVEERVARN